MSNSKNKSPIIVALDYSNLNAALTLIDKLDPNLCQLKVGKEMFTQFGPEFVTRLVKKNFSVFLDLKFHDIPNTVAKACLAAADLGVWMLDVHLLGGKKMLLAAREALEQHNLKPLLIGITILTSMTDEDASEVGLSGGIKAIVNRLTGLAKESGLDGVVCSAHEATELRSRVGKDFYLVTPGIRLQTDNHNDQQRIMTPQAAISAGVDYLVIGRPITTAVDPMRVLQEIQHSIKQIS